MIARVVPDVSGLDKQFDYSIPLPLGQRVRPGAVVRVELHNRRVDAWVVATGNPGDPGFDQVPVDRLLPLLDVADLGVQEDLVPLCAWVATNWCGPLRNVLKSATPERKKSRGANHRTGRAPAVQGPVAEAVRHGWGAGGAVLRVPPLASALDAVVECASHGPVLVLCPTLRMARLGAAALRRRGLTTAELPDQVESAIAGVDVVIGSRSAVFGPCASCSSIVVIDEHEESFHEERVPTWNATEVAVERARRASVPVFLVSPVPSARAEMLLGPALAAGEERPGWPSVEVVDLNDVPVKGSLASSALLDAVSNVDASVLCVVNTKGGAKLLACKSCRSMQTCDSCRSSVERAEDGFLCGACGAARPAVCGGCGRTSFVVLRSGTARIAEELRATAVLPVVEVTASTQGLGSTAAVWVGTDALLHRVSTAACVVFMDVDRDLSAPRMTTGRELMSAVARAARIVGRNGRIVLQTRQPVHPVVTALAGACVDDWRVADAGTARTLSLPPYVSVARCNMPAGWDVSVVPDVLGIEWGADGDVLVVRSADHRQLVEFVGALRSLVDGRMRVEINPPRF